MRYCVGIVFLIAHFWTNWLNKSWSFLFSQSVNGAAAVNRFAKEKNMIDCLQRRKDEFMGAFVSPGFGHFQRVGKCQEVRLRSHGGTQSKPPTRTQTQGKKHKNAMTHVRPPVTTAGDWWPLVQSVCTWSKPCFKWELMVSAIHALMQLNANLHP